MNPTVLKQVDMSPCNKIFKRQLLIDKNLRFPDGLHFEDAYFANAYCWLVKKVVFLPRDTFVYNYRRRPGSVMDGAFTKGRIAVEHMEIGFRLLDVLEQFKVQKEYGQYYMDILVSYIGFTMRFSPGFALPDQWRKLAHWVSYHYATLNKLDPKKTEEIIRWIPDAYRDEFVGSAIQSLPMRAYRKVRRMTRRGFQAAFPAYRAAEKTRRQLVALETQVTAISDSIDRLANKITTYSQREQADD